jgi:hypothetical protein
MRSAPSLRPKRHDSIKPIIAEIGHNSSTYTPVPHCGGIAVAFLPQLFRFSLRF